MFQLELLRGASTDRSSFEANRDLTYQEAASSTNQQKDGLTHAANNEERGLITGDPIEEINDLNFSYSVLR